ncbi:MAG: molybdopterin molybdotransferase MoeA [Stomatobaculum sp.]|nr:molybdopterin molybdotransferase MoeA [Stomatobaculum sp.]
MTSTILSCEEARKRLLQFTEPVGTEMIQLSDCLGRILAEDIRAAADVPDWPRSAFDGYAFRAADTSSASPETPVTLHILEEVPAEKVPETRLTEGTAVRILTGAMLPEGADSVEMFEKTEFTETSVTLFHPGRPGNNVVPRGEDAVRGQLLAAKGTKIDPGLMGVFASQGLREIPVFRIPKVGVISTGTEVVELGSVLPRGKIYNSNRALFEGELRKLGVRPVRVGIARDSVREIRELLELALDTCDAVLLTGGVSVGAYDLTGKAILEAGGEPLFSGVAMKPGKACFYAVRDGKMICALSGNPASAMTNYHAVAKAGLKRLCGWNQGDCFPAEIRVALKEDFPKKSKNERWVRGRLDLSDGTVRIDVPKQQKNSALSSTVGCDVMAVIPAGSGPLPAGTVLQGYLMN